MTPPAAAPPEIPDPAETDYWCFGYGPMVHPAVRQRRGVETGQEQAAILPEYRLTFAFGGVASVVKQRGYDVHGIVMRCSSTQSWNQMQEFEAGYYAATVDVYPYSSSAAAGDEEDDEPEASRPIKARVLIMLEFDESKLERPIEKLPQERYLRLIAAGMRQYGVDQDYIQDQIMAVPFVPSRKPEDYRQFPVLTTDRNNNSQALPKISMKHYQQLCSAAKQDNTHLYFIVGRHVIWSGDHDPQHPGAIWFQRNGMGKGDVTFKLHQTIVDPDVTYCETRADITEQTICWAENHLVEFIGQCGFSAHRVMEVLEEEDDEQEDAIEIENCLSMLRLQAKATTTAAAVDDVIVDDDDDEAQSPPQPTETAVVLPRPTMRRGFSRGFSSRRSRRSLGSNTSGRSLGSNIRRMFSMREKKQPHKTDDPEEAP